MNIAFIPVRGGSKSIPKKNIKPFYGQPLVYWTAKAAQESKNIDVCYIASDCQQINAVVNSFGFDKVKIFNRSAENASDTATTESVMLEFLASQPFQDDDLFFLIQATSPLSTADEFDRAIKQMQTEGTDSLLSGTTSKRFFWNQDGTPLNYDYRARQRRQDFPGLFMENGAFYINKVGNILNDKNRLSGKISLFLQDEIKAVELDEPHDWQLAEAIMSTLQPKPLFPEIKLFISDVDGVMTDGGMYYSENGNELKKFNTIDGMGFERLRNLGIKTAIITSEDTQLVKRRADKLKIDFLVQGKRDGGKLESAKIICQELGISLEQVSYIGDDFNCLELLQNVAIKACPNSAMSRIKEIPGIHILSKNGGEGCVREFAEMIIENSQK